MKTYIAPEVEISMFDVEDIITTSTGGTGTVKTMGAKVAEITFNDLNQDLSDDELFN